MIPKKNTVKKGKLVVKAALIMKWMTDTCRTRMTIRTQRKRVHLRAQMGMTSMIRAMGPLSLLKKMMERSKR